MPGPSSCASVGFSRDAPVPRLPTSPPGRQGRCRPRPNSPRCWPQVEAPPGVALVMAALEAYLDDQGDNDER
jgi:hypothetical protein